ncbi:MAG: DUF4139 domain-containing protein [Hyphomicrobiales bacterium]|nr:DUF4139 domain-containing protein [Hyphomicrobiales bacterium]
MAAELPLKRVVLSTAGLAQFTHAGEVEPGSTLELSVRLDQVDDMLKSLTIFDQQSAIGGVSLPGRAPLEELFRDLPFGPDALESLPNLLNTLVGSEVEIDGETSAKGRLLKVTEETVQLPDSGGQAVQHRLTLMTETGLVQAVLQNLGSVQFTNAETQAQINKALAGIAENQAKERRKLSINLLGENAREAGFSYVVSAPVWKTAYRLVLPQNEGDKVRLQGWAIVENLTGNDWNDVELSLVSGNPVALKQSLYTAFYADRPEVPVTVAQRIVPRKDEADAAVPAAPVAQEQYMAKRSLTGRSGGGIAGVFAMERAEAPTDPIMDQELGGGALAAEAEEASTQISYRFPEKLTLANGSTMMVPFVDREISASRVWLYQPDTNARHPLASVKVENDTETALPAGIITAFDRTDSGLTNFVGDAQLPLTTKGASKFVTFALDAKTDIRRIDNGLQVTRLGKAVNGVLTISTKSIRTIDYEITPPEEEDRNVVIEEARMDGWKPVSSLDQIEMTASRLRYEVDAPKGETTKAQLRLERVDDERLRLSSLAPQQLYATLRGLQNTGSVLKSTLAELSKLVGAINEAEREKAELDEEIRQISRDQERIRENLSAVGQTSDLGRRYLESLRQQEDRLAEIGTEKRRLDTKISETRAEAAELSNRLEL